MSARPPAPPVLARWLAHLVVRGRSREAVLGDLDEEFREQIARGQSAGAARRRYWRQALATMALLARAGVRTRGARPAEGRAHTSAWRADVRPTFYDSILQRLPAGAPAELRVLVRAADLTGALDASLRRAVQRSDPSLAIVGLKTQRDQVDEKLGPERLFARLLTAFGAFALRGSTRCAPSASTDRRADCRV